MAWTQTPGINSYTSGDHRIWTGCLSACWRFRTPNSLPLLWVYYRSLMAVSRKPEASEFSRCFMEAGEEKFKVRGIRQLHLLLMYGVMLAWEPVLTSLWGKLLGVLNSSVWNMHICNYRKLGRTETCLGSKVVHGPTSFPLLLAGHHFPSSVDRAKVTAEFETLGFLCLNRER